VMHFDGLNFSLFFRWGEFNHHTWFEDTSFNSTDWYCSNTTDFVNILEWKSEWFVHRSLWRFKFVEGLVKSFTFIPFHVIRFFDHIITVPSGNWDKLDFFDFVTDFTKIVGNFSFDFFESFLTVFDSFLVHFVNTNDHLFNTKSIS
jgi:hypothetical protein